jgi:hypothetical protein
MKLKTLINEYKKYGKIETLSNWRSETKFGPAHELEIVNFLIEIDLKIKTAKTINKNFSGQDYICRLARAAEREWNPRDWKISLLSFLAT